MVATTAAGQEGDQGDGCDPRRPRPPLRRPPSHPNHSTCAAWDVGSATDPSPGRCSEQLTPDTGGQLYATATTSDSEWVVEVEDVAPDGTSRPLTEGALLGSLRAVDASRSWTAPGGTYLLPYHPYTQESATPVVPGQVTRYDVEVFPTFATLAAGHSVRVTVSTADAPHLTPSAAVLPNLQGGVYQLQRTPAAPSSVQVPLQPVR